MGFGSPAAKKARRPTVLLSCAQSSAMRGLEAERAEAADYDSASERVRSRKKWPRQTREWRAPTSAGSAATWRRRKKGRRSRPLEVVEGNARCESSDPSLPTGK